MRKSLIVIAAGACVAGMAAQAGAASVDFAKDIQPILEKSCIQCHGPEKQKGGLRLDSKEAALKGGKDGVVIVAGQADKSDLLRRITLAPGSDDIMPSKGDPLTKAQTDLIKDWINAGADWPSTAVGKAAPEAEAPAAVSPFAGLTEFKPLSVEAGAMAKLEAAGATVRLVAMNANWKEANLRGLGTNATDATIAPLKDVLTLTELNLAGTGISDTGLQSVSGLTNLIELHLEHTKITDAGLAHLAKLQHLAYLNLYATPVTDKGLESVKSLPGLKRLYLWETKVTDAGADELKKAMPGLMISRGWENEPAAKQAMEEMKAKKEEPKKEEKKPADKKEAKN